LCSAFNCLPSQIEGESWAKVTHIMACRNYRQAFADYEAGKATKPDTELLTRVDDWRREEEG